MPCARPGCPNVATKLRNGKFCSLDCFNLSRRESKGLFAPPVCDVGVKAIPLSQGEWAFVDEDDYGRVVEHNWCAVNAAGSGATPIIYARRSDGVYMHAFILGVVRNRGIECLHGPRGTLDNTKRNLRIGTRADNQRDRVSTGSTSRYKGVSWNFQSRRWSVKITAGTVYQFLGYFSDEVEAASVYDEAARDLHGDFARLNFPVEGEVSAVPGAVARECLNCESTFDGTPGLDYCGQLCLSEMSLNERRCLKCERPMLGYAKFCSDGCKVAFEETCWSPGPPSNVSGASWVRLTLGKWALVDDGDLPLVLGPNGDASWFAKEGRGRWYAARNASISERHQFGRMVSMHRLMLNLSRNDERMVDHVDGDGLNNRRLNLRLADNSSNQSNTLAYGVCRYKGVVPLKNGFFLAKIFARGHHEYLGRFRSPEEAALAYDAKARAMHGASGRYNFPDPGERSAF